MKNLLKIFLLVFYFSSIGLAQNTPLWMRYPAISPDGEKIVFSYQGDLFLISSKGGTAIPITLHDGHDYMPVWSNDGKFIAFASDRYGNFDVFIMPSQGGPAERLTYHSANDFPSDFTANDQEVVFTSLRLDMASSVQFPNSAMPELYSVPTKGGTPKIMNTMPAEYATFSKDGNTIIYHDRKGYENEWRKHHESSITRDIWTYNTKTKVFSQVTTWEGEDRNPVMAGNSKAYFLSERSGSFNIFTTDVNNPKEVEQLTQFKQHPVRFLTASDNGKLSYTYDGEIYTQEVGQEPKKLPINIAVDSRSISAEIIGANGNVTEIALSPNGKEIAYVVRGEIYVTAVDNGLTKRVTNTPEQERSVSFSKDGRSILYAAERNNNWNIYQSSIKREEEAYFYSSTVILEKPIVSTSAEEFQPTYSPDGKEVAYLEERTTLKTINLSSNTQKTILPAKFNYSYSDGDQYYSWSPDSKWLLVQYLEGNWITEVGLASANGDQKVINLSNSGFFDTQPKWAMEGNMMIWNSNRDGQKDQGSWGAEGDVYAMFFNQKSYDRFNLSKEELELVKEKEEEDLGDKKDEKEIKLTPLTIDLKNIEDRKARLTIHSSNLQDAVMSPDGETLYYLTNIDKGFDIWMTTLRDKSTKRLVKLGGSASNLIIDKKGKYLFVQSDGGIFKVKTDDGSKEPVSFNAEMNLVKAEERNYIFDHVWRQVDKKFYTTDLHGVDWPFYKKEYAKFLPHINNNYDFSEMLSEMLGELNASHTGAYYRPSNKMGNETASLGVFYDQDYTGNGMKIHEVMLKGPADKSESDIDAGVIIEKIDGESIDVNKSFFALLNRKNGKNTLLSLYDSKSKKRWEEVIQPISLGEENELRYQRWVKKSREAVDELSAGKVGYVHIRGMNDGSFRTAVEEILGRNKHKESIIVDTRSNGGGWLHEDLATFLDGKAYVEMAPRDQRLGTEPMFKWSKPSAVIMGESNYSDAHIFPYAYRAKGIGKLVGMPVPGTGTAVWWERQIDPTLVFGIPQVGMLTPEGEYLENKQLMPDVMVQNDPAELIKGVDQQLAKAVEVLIGETVDEKIDIEIKESKGEK